MFRTLDDIKKDSKNNKKDEKNKKTTESYTGGHSSGMAVENPDDNSKFTGNYDNLLNKAKKNIDKEHEDKQKIKITIYKNGFQLDDGPFRALNDEKNKHFMADIEKGYVPQELVEKGFKDLIVSLENKKDQDYVEPIPEKKFEAFIGSGVSLGNVTSKAGEINKNFEFNVDKSSPTTKINIRIHNGEVISQEFNLTHAVSDIYQFVQKMTNVNGSFSLKEGFPPKVLSDKSKTIAEMKLQGTTLIQSLN